MRDELDSYLSVFSSGGSIPSSLSGYGLGAAQQTAAEKKRADAERYPPVQSPSREVIVNDSVKAENLQSALNALRVYVKKTGVFDAATKAAFERYAYGWKEPHSQIAVLQQNDKRFDKFVYITAAAKKRLGERAKASPLFAEMEAKAIGWEYAEPKTQKQVSKPSTAGNTSGSTSGYTTGTADVQDVLIRLGWKGKGTTKGAISKDLTDGTYGTTVVELWTQSAKKRGLVPTITKASADGTQVSVVEKTFLMLKAAADALVPPTRVDKPIGSSMASLGPDVVSVVTAERLGDVLGRLVDAKSDQTGVALFDVYKKVAQARGLDARIEVLAENNQKAWVYKKTWDALVVDYDKKAPAPPTPKPQERSAVELAMGNVDKVADTRIEAPVLRDFFNISIKQGLVKREAFSGDKWSADYAPLIVTMLKVDGPVKQAWEQMLVPGKLVNKNLKFARLPGAQVASITAAVNTFNAAQKAETSRYVGYTKVNTAQVIEAINKTGVSTKKFNPSGGAQELADAVKTLLENTKTSVSGDLVRTDAAKNVFVKNEVLGAMLAVGLDAGKRLAASESYRKNIVDEALKASSASVTIDQVQQAFMETVSAGKAGKNKALFAAVKRTGAFDNATRAAYTELARTLTIGPAIQQFQKLLPKQSGPAFVNQVSNDVWNEFLTKAVSKTSIAIMPVIASGVVAASNAYTSRVSASTDERTKIAELNKALATAVKQSNSIISILDVQQGLLQLLSQKEITKLTTWDGKPSGVVKITGVADAATRDGLFSFASTMIFPKGLNIPETLWRQYTDAVGIRVVSATNVQKGWNAANYVALPQALASLLSERAGGWIAKHGLSVYAQNLTPVPLQNQDLQLRFDKPSVVTVRVPGKPVDTRDFDDKAEKNLAAKKAAAKVKKDAAYNARKRAQVAAKVAAANPTSAPAQAAAQTAATEATKAETEAVLADRSASAAQQTADGGQASGGQAAGGEAAGGQAAGGQASGGQGGSVGPISINIPGGGSFTTPGEPAPAPAPTPAPAEPEPPVAPIQAGMGSSWLLMSAFGLGALFFLKDDKKKNPQRTAVRGR